MITMQACQLPSCQSFLKLTGHGPGVPPMQWHSEDIHLTQALFELQVGEEKFPSAVPFLPPLTDATMTQYFRFYTAAVASIVIFGGLLSPILEVKLGLGGESVRLQKAVVHDEGAIRDIV